MKKCELLAPAGDLERLHWAFDYGADAVYIGGKDYSLRANANNFTDSELEEAIDYAHSINKKVYVTVNMLFHDEDFKNIIKYLKFLDNINVDGVIISDLGVLNLVKNNTHIGKIILSTQTSVCNYEAALFYQNLGINKIVLARECSKKDIKKIIENTSLDVETFIHGAMCTSFSGRCLLSNYITLRDSNRGGCSQVCRFMFETPNNKKFSISSKDLNMIDYVSDMMDLGINSFKIEGRMKSLYYIATVVNVYRNLIDKKVNGSLKKKDILCYKKVLSHISNKENIAQFYNGEYGSQCEYFSEREEKSNQDFLGIVVSYDSQNKLATIEQRNNFKAGDVVEVFGPQTEVFNDKIKFIKNSAGNNVNVANRVQENVIINIKKPVCKGDILRVKIT